MRFFLFIQLKVIKLHVISIIYKKKIIAILKVIEVLSNSPIS
jgi:hypothetical protein